MSSGIFAAARPYDGAKGGGGMKTIVACALLAALAFGLLPGMEQQWIPEDDGLVLLVETDAAQNEAAQSVSGAADRSGPSGGLGQPDGSGFSRGRRFWSFPWRTT